MDQRGLGNSIPAGSSADDEYGLLDEPSWKLVDWTSLENRIMIDGMSIKYVDIGRGEPPTLLLHGIGASYRSWLTTIPTLSQKRRVIALDLPGFGSSNRTRIIPGAARSARCVERVCQRLDLAQVDVVGHSMGGFFAMQFAHSYPRRVRKLVLVGTHLYSVLELYRRPIMALVANTSLSLRFARQMVLAAIPAPRFVLEAIVDRPNLRKILCSAFVIDAGKLDRDTLLETVSFGGSLNTLPTVAMGFAFRFDEVADSLTATKAGKILVVAADGDDLATPEEAEIFSARIGAAKLVVLSNAGHWAMLEQPKRLNRIIDGWLS